MLLISIHPFVFRKIFLLAVALLGLSSVLCFADSLFMARQYGSSGGIVHAAVRGHVNKGAYALLPVWEYWCVKKPSCLPTVPFVDATSVKIGFEMDRTFATRDLPLSQTSAWIGSDAGLTQALPTQDRNEFNSF